MNDTIQIRDTLDVPKQAVLDLYRSVDWSSANKPDQLHQALLHSDSLITAWDGDRLVGLANAISDGFLVVYYPHFVVHTQLPAARNRASDDGSADGSLSRIPSALGNRRPRGCDVLREMRLRAIGLQSHVDL